MESSRLRPPIQKLFKTGHRLEGTNWRAHIGGYRLEGKAGASIPALRLNTITIFITNVLFQYEQFRRHSNKKKSTSTYSD